MLILLSCLKSDEPVADDVGFDGVTVVAESLNATESAEGTINCRVSEQ